MDRASDRTADAVPATVEHELRLINEAIAMVASGAAPRTVVAGLQLGDQLLETAQRMADQAGVRLTPLWHADEHGLDIEIDRGPA
jgi:diphthamide synthase (EF-2-diphthine--ammonia ligase)